MMVWVLSLLFWKLLLLISGFVLVIARWLDAAPNRPPGAAAVPLFADSVPYQQSLHTEIPHPATDALSSGRLAQGTTNLQKWLRLQSVSFWNFFLE